MILFATLGLMLVLSLRAVFDWRSATYGMILMTQLQDPVRKITPGAPGYLVLLVGPVLIGGLVGLIVARPGWWREFATANPEVASRVQLMIVLAMPAAFVSATYGAFGWAFTLLGAASYTVLFLSIILGFHLLREERELRRLMTFYCITTSLMLIGGWFEFFGLFGASPLIGTDALGLEWLRYRPGYTVNLIAGFYRSPDVMGWHAAACAMLGMVMLLTSRGLPRLFWSFVVLLAIGALVLCGRRKMAYMLPLFLVLVPLFRAWVGHGRGALSASLAAAAVVFGAAVVFDASGGAQSDFLRYYLEGSVETVDRVDKHGLNSVLVTFRQQGFLGGGLGFATPGAQHLPFPRPYIWQESGPARFAFEFGVPGLLGLALLGLALLRGAWKSLSFSANRNAKAVLYCSCLLAFFLANVGSLTVSGQILGDPFITSFIGLSLGLVLGFRRIDRGPARSSLTPAPARTATSTA